MTGKDHSLPPALDEVAAHLLVPAAPLVDRLLERAQFSPGERQRAGALARRLVHGARLASRESSGAGAFLREYGLSSEEGVILMCLAEALLRIPDAATQDAFIAGKIAEGQWERHLGRSESLFVNASTWGLMLTGRLIRFKEAEGGHAAGLLKRLAVRSGEPLIRSAIRHAIQLLSGQFVLSATIEDALRRARPLEAKGVRFSYDMLGEAARTATDANRYFERYLAAVEAVGQAIGRPRTETREELMARPGISVKLSALHPRFEPAKEMRLRDELVPRLVTLARAARRHGLSLTVDAEEQERLAITLAVFGAAFLDPALEGWHGLGLAVQAYGKRTLPVLRWLRALAAGTRRRIPVRLVRGAYWDSEIKWAQERGLAEYPVFTNKLHTDISYLAAMRFLLAEPEAFFPQLATHNAHTLATAITASGDAPYELQRLYGMGEALYAQIAGESPVDIPVRVYAPVGSASGVVPYLMRRFLENGANTSFLHRLADTETPIAEIVRDPLDAFEQRHERDERAESAFQERLPLPRALWLPQRQGSVGLPLYDGSVRESLYAKIKAAIPSGMAAAPLLNGTSPSGRDGSGDHTAPVRCPHNRQAILGSVRAATPSEISEAIAAATAAVGSWERLGAERRADILDRAAALFEENEARLLALVIREGGKTLEAAHAELREATDYLRYYAAEARRLFSRPQVLEGPTGERNTLELRARGPFACISPWNFPLAIYTGQAAAALAAGNPVLAKPAPETPLTAFAATELLLKAGVPPEALQFLPGGGDVGEALVRDRRVEGVAFTGSIETAWIIQRALADRRGAIVPFIAETGGINAMIVDSTALPEQVVRDAVRSAFESAGQRCSAARVLFVQEDIAPAVIPMLVGAIEELELGDPLAYATDVGPVISEEAEDALEAHKMRMQRIGRTLVDLAVPPSCSGGTYVGPAAYEIESLALLEREVFGPILHVVRFSHGRLDKVIEALNATGYGLTLGLHSRIAAVSAYVAAHARVGNLYVNRHQTGAVVGVQPFGGEGLSGTGPKAGGPFTLIRFATERVCSTDLTATGGNVQLLNETS